MTDGKVDYQIKKTEPELDPSNWRMTRLTPEESQIVDEVW
jgi:hypothetical protein